MLRAIVPLLTGLLLAASAAAQPPRRQPAPSSPEALRLTEQWRQASANVRTCAATVELSIRETDGRWTRTQTTTYAVALDRIAGRVRIDRPDVLLVCDGVKLRVRSDQFPGRYVEVDAPRPLTFGALLGLVPFLDQPPLPELVPLLSDDPLAQFTSGAGAVVELAPSDLRDPEHHPGIAFDTPMGRMTLRLSAQTFLVVGAELALDPARTIHYRVLSAIVNEPLDAHAFDFDTLNQAAVPSLAQLAGGAATPAQAPGGAPAPDPAAPPVQLSDVDGQPFKLADRTEKVVVLCFWASWSPQCRATLQELHQLQEWIDRQKRSAVVVTVNVMESAQQVRQVWSKQRWALPVLLDAESKVADSYNVQVLPHTAVVSAGKVVLVASAGTPNLEATLRAKIDELTPKETP